jgi:hypothetical protein
LLHRPLELRGTFLVGPQQVQRRGGDCFYVRPILECCTCLPGVNIILTFVSSFLPTQNHRFDNTGPKDTVLFCPELTSDAFFSK